MNGLYIALGVAVACLVLMMPILAVARVLQAKTWGRHVEHRARGDAQAVRAIYGGHSALSIRMREAMLEAQRREREAGTASGNVQDAGRDDAPPSAVERP